MRSEVIETHGTVSDDHLAQQAPALRVAPDRSVGLVIEAVVHERGQLPGMVVDTQGGVAGIGDGDRAGHDALQHGVAVVGAGQLKGSAEQQHPQPVGPLTRRDPARRRRHRLPAGRGRVNDMISQIIGAPS